MSLLSTFLIGAEGRLSNLAKARQFCNSAGGIGSIPCKVNNPDSPTSLDPIGGYISYSQIRTSAGANHLPTSPVPATAGLALQTACQSAVDNDTIWLDPDIVYDCSSLHIYIAAENVEVFSGRGSGGSEGAMIKTDTLYSEKVYGLTDEVDRIPVGGDVTFEDLTSVLLRHSQGLVLSRILATPYYENNGGNTKITLAGSHRFSIGDKVYIWGGTGAEATAYNGGPYTVTDWHDPADEGGLEKITIDAAYASVTASGSAWIGFEYIVAGNADYNGTYVSEQKDSQSIYLTSTVDGSRLAYGAPSSLVGKFVIHRDHVFALLGDGIHFSGLRIQGPDPTKGKGTTESFNDNENLTVQGALFYFGNSGEVDNCEIYNFPKFGIYLLNEPSLHHIHHNFIHHCQRDGYGYGVWVNDSTGVTISNISKIEANIFAHCRHNAAAGDKGSYIFRWNFQSEHYNAAHSVDWHQNGGIFGLVEENIFASGNGAAVDGFDTTPSNWPTGFLTVRDNYSDHDTFDDFFSNEVDLGIFNTITFSDNTLEADNWHSSRPIVTISVDDDLHTSPSGDIVFTAIATDPFALPIDAYFWMHGGSAFTIKSTPNNILTLTGLTTGIHVIHVVARNTLGFLSRPSTITVEVSSNASTSIKHKMICSLEANGDLTDSHDFGYTIIEGDEGAVEYSNEKGGTGSTAFSFNQSTSINAVIKSDNCQEFMPFQEDFSISFSLMVETIPAPLGYYGIMKIGGGSSQSPGWRISLRESSGLANLHVAFSNGIKQKRQEFGTQLNEDDWYSVVVTFDRTAATMELYVDSVSYGSIAIDSVYLNAYGFDFFELAHQFTTVTGNLYLNRLIGRLDKIRLFRRKLTTTQINTLHNSGDYLSYGELV